MIWRVSKLTKKKTQIGSNTERWTDEDIMVKSGSEFDLEINRVELDSWPQFTSWNNGFTLTTMPVATVAVTNSRAKKALRSIVQRTTPIVLNYGYTSHSTISLRGTWIDLLPFLFFLFSYYILFAFCVYDGQCHNTCRTTQLSAIYNSTCEKAMFNYVRIVRKPSCQTWDEMRHDSNRVMFLLCLYGTSNSICEHFILFKKTITSYIVSATRGHTVVTWSIEVFNPFIIMNIIHIDCWQYYCAISDSRNFFKSKLNISNEMLYSWEVGILPHSNVKDGSKFINVLVMVVVMEIENHIYSSRIAVNDLI